MKTATYGPDLTLREARAAFFERSGFPPDGGYADRWVKLRLGPLPLWFPNTEGRRRAVPFHDLHHVLTEYPTTWRGEFEVAAWEVATGLRRHHIGWLLDLLGFASGLVVNPVSLFRAFVRGRRSLNLYGGVWGEGDILARRVGEVRRSLRLDAPAAPARLGDVLSFAVWAAVSVITYFVTGAVLLLPAALAVAAVLWLGGVV